MYEVESPSDALLMGQIANGEPDSVRPLIERYSRPLAALFGRAIGSSPDVDDLLQETWIRVVRSAHRYDPEQRFTAWLFAIAWNLVRTRWRQRTDHHDIASIDPETSDPNAEERAIAHDSARRLRELVARLPERLSETVLLRYFEDLSEREIAVRLGIPLGTVKSRLHHGLKRLKETHELQ